MERIFVVIGRINSILLLVALLGAGAFIGWMSWSSAQGQRRGAVEVPAGQTEKASPVFLRFERIRNIPGADTQMMELTTEDKSGKFSSGGYSEIRNVLFLAGNDKEARWLFPTHSNLILAAVQLREPREDSDCPGTKMNPTRALYFEYVTSDTDGDKKLTAQDRAKVALTKPDGTNFVEVLDGVDRVLSYEMPDSRHLTVIYQKDKSIHHARFSVTTMTKELDREIVGIPDRL